MKIKTKLIIAVIVAVFVGFATLVAVHIFGIDESPTIKYPKDFTVITTETAYDNEEFIEALGYSVESFSNHLGQNGIISFAANKDNSSQFTLSERTTDLSTQLYDISDASDKEIESIAKSLIKEGFSGTWRIGGRTFLEVTTKVQNDENSYCSVQYITIVGGKYYSLNYYGSNPTLTEADKKVIEKTMSNLKIKDEGGIVGSLTSADTGRIFYIVLVALVGITGIVFVILLSASLVRDYIKKRRSEEDGLLRIKRRKTRR